MRLSQKGMVIKMKVLILGGTGVISTEIVKLLLKHHHDVTVYNRGNKQVPKDVQVILGDRGDRAAFARQFQGARFDAVIDMIAFNPDDAKSTIEIFGKCTDQILVCSSTAAYKRPYTHQPVKEDNPLWDDAEHYDYGYQKAEMERYLYGQMKQGVPITILRPCQTWGIGSKTIGALRTNYGLIERIKAKKPIIVNGDGANPWVWTFAPDLAKAFVGVLGKQCCIGECYHATSDEPHIWDDLYNTFGRFVGEKPTLLHISTELLYEANPGLFEHLLYDKRYCGLFDNSKIKRHVPEFQCEYTLEKGLRMIYDWFLSDEYNREINPRTVAFEDKLCELYDMWKNQMRDIREN